MRGERERERERRDSADEPGPRQCLHPLVEHILMAQYSRTSWLIDLDPTSRSDVSSSLVILSNTEHTTVEAVACGWGGTV